MKKKTELHPALSAMTTKEYDAIYPKLPTLQGIRPLTPMVPCGECERLRVENEALRAVVIAADELVSAIYARKGGTIDIDYLSGCIMAARENGVID